MLYQLPYRHSKHKGGIVADFYLWYRCVWTTIPRMTNQTLVGQLVTVNSARGPIDRVVAFDLGDVVILALQDDYKDVKIAGIGPFSIGFRRHDLVLDDLVLRVRERSERREAVYASRLRGDKGGSGLRRSGD